MKKRTFIVILTGMLAALFAMLFLAACGSKEESSTTGYKCDVKAPIIIPEPDGKPQYIYFYRDT